MHAQSESRLSAREVFLWVASFAQTFFDNCNPNSTTLLGTVAAARPRAPGAPPGGGEVGRARKIAHRVSFGGEPWSIDRRPTDADGGPAGVAGAALSVGCSYCLCIRTTPGHPSRIDGPLCQLAGAARAVSVLML